MNSKLLGQAVHTAGRCAAIALLGAGLTGLVVSDALAATLGYDISTGALGNGSALNLGVRFSIPTAITVTDLGVWDEGANGLASSLQLGLWTSTGTLLSQTTISGTGNSQAVSAFGSGQWVFNDITDVTLAAGTYVVSVFYPSGNTDTARINGAGVNSSSPVTVLGNNFLSSSSFVFPTTVGSGAGVTSGANFLFTTTVTPLPAALPLFASGLGALSLLGWRRKKKAAALAA